MGATNVAGRYPEVNVPGLLGPDTSVTASLILAGGLLNQGLNNPIGLAAALGALGSLDALGGGVVGGTDPPPTTARSGISGSGRGTSTQCMSSNELNAHMGGTPPFQAPEGFGEPYEGARVPTKFCSNCTHDSIARLA